MSLFSRPSPRTLLYVSLLIATLISASIVTSRSTSAEPTDPSQTIGLNELEPTLQIGDVVFIRVDSFLFKKVADSTGSWVNHVGIVVDIKNGAPVIAESTVPLVTTTNLPRFASRSENGRIAVSRPNTALNDAQQKQLQQASTKRMGTHYDTGFDLHSSGQFCSRFVREVFAEASGVELGEVETFRALLNKNANVDLTFWRRWFLGDIPWQRETVTPASVLASKQLHPIFDGYAE